MKTSLISAMIHLAIVGLVVLLTPAIGSTKQRPPERPPIMIYRPPPPPDAGPTLPGKGGFGGAPRTSIPFPTTVPPNIPTIDIPKSGPVRVLLDSGWGPSPRATYSGGNGGSQGSPTGALTAEIVDVQVAPYAGAPAPRYPEALRAAGVEGEVTLEFVVDTAGRLEGGSLRVISSTAEPFVVSVRDALLATRYHPALVGGHHVRQIVRQSFVFSLTQR